jgi:hypothetical protein
MNWTRVRLVIGAVAWLAAAAWAQAPVAPKRTYGSSHGFGNVLFPGTGSAPNMHPSAITPPPSHGQRLSATIQGRPMPAEPITRGRQKVYSVPYLYPIVVGGWGWGWSAPSAPADVNVNIVQAPPAQPAPAVIINQYYTPDSPKPVLKEYPEGSLPETVSQLKVYEAPGPKFPDPAEKTARAAEDKPTLYLIAFKSGAVYPALAYWVEDDTLHYITRDKSLNKASLALIDRELSAQLNRERNIDFQLPPQR